jgi:hypothetical protein
MADPGTAPKSLGDIGRISQVGWRLAGGSNGLAQALRRSTPIDRIFKSIKPQDGLFLPRINPNREITTVDS